MSTIDQNEHMQRIVSEGITPHADTIARICDDGGIAVVVFEPDATAKKLGKQLGWDKYSAPVVRLSPQHAARLATSDAATRKWLARTDCIRVFLIAGSGTLLLKFDLDAKGWCLEPGSSDVELKAARN